MVICTFIKIGGDISFQSFIDTFFSKLNWYLYAYFDYLLMLPFLRIIAQNAKEVQVKAWFILVTVFYTMSGCLTFINYYTGLIDFAPIYNTMFASSCWSIIFAVTGYFLATYDNTEGQKSYLFFVVGTVISIALSVVFVVSDLSNNEVANIEQLRLHFIYLPSCLIFCICKVLCDWAKIFTNEIVKKSIVMISGTTFGIFIIETHSELINYINWKISLSPYLNCLGDYAKGGIAIILQFAICFMIVFVLKQLPYLKKIL